MKHLSEFEIKNVSGGSLGSFITKGIDNIGRGFTIYEVGKLVSDHFSKEHDKMVADFKRDPSTVTNRFSFNGDF